MPTNYTPTPEVYDGSAVSTLVDGDAVNRDNLYVEASPGGTKKLTLGALLNWVAGLSDATTGILARLAKTTAPAGGTLIGLRAHTGAAFTIAAGTLQDFLELLADNAVRLDVANTFTEATVITDALQVDSLISLGTTSLQGATHVDDLRVDAAPSLTGGTVSASATTQTIDDSKPIWTATAWNGSGGKLAVTISTATTSGARAEFGFFFDPTQPSHQAVFTRAGAGSSFLTVTGKGFVKFRWDGSSFREVDPAIIGQGAAMSTSP